MLCVMNFDTSSIASRKSSRAHGCWYMKCWDGLTLAKLSALALRTRRRRMEPKPWMSSMVLVSTEFHSVTAFSMPVSKCIEKSGLPELGSTELRNRIESMNFARIHGRLSMVLLRFWHVLQIPSGSTGLIKHWCIVRMWFKGMEWFSLLCTSVLRILCRLPYLVPLRSALSELYLQMIAVFLVVLYLQYQ